MDKDKFPKAELTPEEQKEFKGRGVCQAERLADDVHNINNDGGCVCYYKNRSAVVNTNNPMGCICSCTL